MRYLLALIFITLCLNGWGVSAQEPLPYPAREAVKRQTMNMNEIEKQLDQQLATANGPANPAQQALIAQFNQMLNSNPQLKGQFDAATAEQQAAFMLQFGIIMPGAAQDQQFAFILQKLDSVTADLEKGNVPKDHPEVLALYSRVNAAKQKIDQIKQKQASNTQQALADNDLSEFPDFETHLKQATAFTLAIRDAVLAARALSGLGASQPQGTQMWLLEANVPDYQLRALYTGIEKLALYEQQINSWNAQYQPLLARSAVFQGQWQDVYNAFLQVAPALRSEAPAAVNALAAHIQHNIKALAAMTDDALARQMTAMFGRTGGISQIRGLIERGLSYYPETSLGGYAQKSALQAEQANALKAVDAAEASLTDRLTADRRMPADSYAGDDAQALKDKALKLLSEISPGAAVHSVTICCDWVHVKEEEWVQPVPDKWERKLTDHRDIQIAIAVIADDTYADIKVIGVRQDFIRNRELVEFLGEKRMLAKNL